MALEQRGYDYNLCLTDTLGSGMSLVTLWSRRDETLDHWELVFSAARDAAPGVFDEVAPRTKWTLLSDKSKGLKGAATKQLPQVKHLNDSYHKVRKTIVGISTGRRERHCIRHSCTRAMKRKRR